MVRNLFKKYNIQTKTFCQRCNRKVTYLIIIMEEIYLKVKPVLNPEV